MWTALSGFGRPFLRAIAARGDLGDSWAIDCHKWLNVLYDSGIAMVREPEHLRRALAQSAAYLQTSDVREPCHYTPESSRRARGIELWAAIRSLGREGLREVIERNCRLARVFGERLEQQDLKC
jgi:glutamate/tyrosine decarboxylase-like PLP-dependent enzyme